ncbi:MAG: hypothetical protein WDO12_02840 [Pseudomonadota bacterium]
MPDTRTQIATFIGRYSPSVARQFRAARTHVRKLFPRGYELVHDNYNAFGCGYSSTPLASGVIVSVVAYPRWVTLFFFSGPRLPDPEGLLQGTGSKVRSVRLEPLAVLESDAVHDLLAATIAPFAAGLKTKPRLSTIIKTQSAKRRPRRPPARKTR